MRRGALPYFYEGVNSKTDEMPTLSNILNKMPYGVSVKVAAF